MIRNIIQNIDSYLLGIFIVVLLWNGIKFLLEKGQAMDVNAVYNTWAKKTLWIWLPFYALRRLIREVIFGLKR